MTIRNIAVPVKDLPAATAFYKTLLGTDPYVDQPYYVGFRVEGAPEIGLDPHGDLSAGPVAFHVVDDIDAKVEELTALGAKVEQSPRDIGGGAKVARLRDAEGNMFGLFAGDVPA